MEEQKQETHVCTGRKEDYSTTQWRKPLGKRRCKECVGNPPAIAGRTHCEVRYCHRRRQPHHPRHCAAHAANEECKKYCMEGDHTDKCQILTLMKEVKTQLNSAIGRVTTGLALSQTNATKDELVESLGCLRSVVRTHAPQYQAQGTEMDDDSSGQDAYDSTDDSPASLEGGEPSDKGQARCHCPAQRCRTTLAQGGLCDFCVPKECSHRCICACEGECSGDEWDNGH